MPYGGGIFAPSETAYKDPNRFADVLEAEGNKQARYLAEMDQFYTQLEEYQRQFDVTVEMKERFFEEEMAFKEEELEWKGQQSALDRALRRWESGQQTSLGRAQLAGQERYRGGLLSLEKEKFELGKGESEFIRGLHTKEEARTRETHDVAKELITGDDRGFQDDTFGFKPSYYDPFGAESISSYMERKGG